MKAPDFSQLTVLATSLASAAERAACAAAELDQRSQQFAAELDRLCSAYGPEFIAAQLLNGDVPWNLQQALWQVERITKKAKQ